MGLGEGSRDGRPETWWSFTFFPPLHVFASLPPFDDVFELTSLPFASLTYQTYGPGNAIWLPLDVTKESDWLTAISHIESSFGPLDVCCNNAGIATQTDMNTTRLGELELRDYDRMMEVNVRGVVLGSKFAAQSMVRNDAEEWRSIIK